MKKFIAFMLCGTMIFSSSIVIFANNNYYSTSQNFEEVTYKVSDNSIEEISFPIEPTNGIIYTISEYDIIEKLKLMSDEELLESGYDQDKINQIRKLNLIEIVNENKELSDDELIEKGFTEEKIKAIRGEDLEAAQRAITGTLTCKNTFYSLDYDSKTDKTTAKTIFTWEWDKCPFVTFNDIVGISISNDMYLDEDASKVWVRYYDNGDWNEKYITKTYSPKPEEPTSFASCIFDMNLFNKPSVNPPQVALKGNATLVWTKRGELVEGSTLARYGHAISSVKLGFSVGKSGISFSFTPSKSIDITGEEYDYFER